MEITTIGIDLAKKVFQVHGVYPDGSVAFNKPLRRAQMLPFFAGLRGLLSEFGITMPVGIRHLREFAVDMQAGEMLDLPEMAEDVIASLCDQLIALDGRIDKLEKAIFAAATTDVRVDLLRSIPGIGPITASAIVATVGSGRQFRSGRDFAAWIGLTPINKSSGGKETLGRITRMGDQYLVSIGRCNALLKGVTMAGKWRPGKTSGDQQARRPLSANATDPWRPRGAR
ncbi:MAG: hypothetical protein AcusKO_03090 [Acuticoccus sp.]